MSKTGRKLKKGSGVALYGCAILIVLCLIIIGMTEIHMYARSLTKAGEANDTVTDATAYHAGKYEIDEYTVIDNYADDMRRKVNTYYGAEFLRSYTGVQVTGIADKIVDYSTRTTYNPYSSVLTSNTLMYVSRTKTQFMDYTKPAYIDWFYRSLDYDPFEDMPYTAEYNYSDSAEASAEYVLTMFVKAGMYSMVPADPRISDVIMCLHAAGFEEQTEILSGTNIGILKEGDILINIRNGMMGMYTGNLKVITLKKTAEADRTDPSVIRYTYDAVGDITLIDASFNSTMTFYGSNIYRMK